MVFRSLVYALPAVSSEHCRQACDGHQAMWSYLTCALPAALASCAAAHRVQHCDSCPPVLVRQRPGLPGRQLSARRRRPNQTTAFCIHSNTRQSDAQQLWRQDLCRRRTTSLEQSAAQSQDYVGCHTASSGGYWRHLYSDSEATAQCELFLTAPNRNILTYLHTITVMLAG